MNQGKIQFHSSMKHLNEGFKWAKEQALFYAHDKEDPVGAWYEAALPGRNAFCIRDVCHQAAGAAALGLTRHTKNMLYQFAENISEGKDYCTWWEITKDGKPCPDDYNSDEDFWYNLPANFEIIRACYLQYLWTKDEDYINDPVFLDFYKMSCQEYVQKWDVDKDGILEHYSEYKNRGIATYNEADVNIKTAGDMLASQYAGYGFYARILRLRREAAEAVHYEKKQQELKHKYLTRWYDEESHGFYGAMLMDGSFYKNYDMEGNFLPLYYGILDDEKKMQDALNQLREQEPSNVEGRSYYPQLFYDCGDERKGYEYLSSLCEASLSRREYPEVSYALIGTMTNCLMGVKASEENEIITRSKLPEGEWASLTNVALIQKEIDITHHGKTESILKNNSDTKLTWKAVFEGNHEAVWHDNKRLTCSHETDIAGEETSFVLIEVGAGKEVSLKRS